MTSSRLAVYSADNVTLSVGGYVIDSGYADGEFVSIEMAADDYALKTGADGEGALAKSNNRSATIHIKLLQTSLGNNLLTMLRNSGLATPNGAALGALMVVDRTSGVQLAHAAKCWVSKPPTVSLGREISENEWVLMTNFVDLNVMGSPSV